MSRSAAAIDRARAREARKAVRSMPDLCTISGPGAETRDSFGEVSTADSILIPSCPCKILQLSALERLTGGEIAAKANAKLQIPVDAQTAAIGANARGTILARGAVGAKDFEITGPPLPASDHNWFYLAIIVK
jgi:hypothetical protein